MNDVVTVDTNLLLLIVVGSTDPALIASHKRLDGYSVDDFQFLRDLVGMFPDVMFVPNVITEVSNLAAWGVGPARWLVRGTLRRLIQEAEECYVPSKLAAERHEFTDLGLTDSVLLTLCATQLDGRTPTLLTVDEELYNRALGHGYSVINYDDLR